MVFIVIVLLWLAASLAGGLVIGAPIRRGTAYRAILPTDKRSSGSAPAAAPHAVA